jgi:hypothetical protein
MPFAACRPTAGKGKKKKKLSKRAAAEETRKSLRLCVRFIGSGDHEEVEPLLKAAFALTARPAGVRFVWECSGSWRGSALDVLIGEGHTPTLVLAKTRFFSSRPRWVVRTGPRLVWAQRLLQNVEKALVGVLRAAGDRAAPAARIVKRADAPLYPQSRYTRRDLRKAWLAALGWMIAGAFRGDAGQLSDYLQVFLIIWRSAAPACLRSLGHRIGRRLARLYKRVVKPPTAKSDLATLFDVAAGLFLLNRFGMQHPKVKKALEKALAGQSRNTLLRQSQNSWDETAEGVLDALVDLYFLKHLGFALPVPYIKVVARALTFPFKSLVELGGVRFDSQSYLVTHTIYVLSDFDLYALDPAKLKRHVSYLKTHLDYYVDMDDVETVGEFGDCLKILGFDYQDAAVRKVVSHLLSWQNADGSFGAMKDVDAYVRYHSTWTAFNGILEYRFSGRGPHRAEIKALLEKINTKP